MGCAAPSQQRRIEAIKEAERIAAKREADRRAREEAAMAAAAELEARAAAEEKARQERDELRAKYAEEKVCVVLGVHNSEPVSPVCIWKSGNCRPWTTWALMELRLGHWWWLAGGGGGPAARAARQRGEGACSKAG